MELVGSLLTTGCLLLVLVNSSSYLLQWDRIQTELLPYTTTETTAYFSTPVRSALYTGAYLGAAGSCYLLLVFVLQQLIGGTEGRPVMALMLPLLALAFVMLIVPRIAPLKRLTETLRYGCQRRIYVPHLPSREATNIVRQLRQYPSTFQPDPTLLLDYVPQPLIGQTRWPTEGQPRDIFCFRYARLLYMYKSIVSARDSGQFKAAESWGSELEFTGRRLEQLAQRWQQHSNRLSVTHFRAMETEIIDLTDRCFHMISCMVLKRCHQREARRKTFQQFGLLVNVNSALWLTSTRPALTAIIKLAPSAHWRQQLLEKLYDDRRKSPRIHCYRSTRLCSEDSQIEAPSLELSKTGAAITTNTPLATGTVVELMMQGDEGIVSCKAQVIRKKADQCIVRFEDTSRADVESFYDNYCARAA